MNKIVKYVCIFIILVGIFCLFSGVYTKEGYTTKASQYATAAEGGKVGITKAAVSSNKSMAGYGSNGIAKKGYDGNGRAILDYNENGVPIVGYQGNHPVLGTPAPAPPTNIPQLGPVGEITGFNSDGTPIFDNAGTTSAETVTKNQPLPSYQDNSSPSNAPIAQSGPVQRFNF
jgi:hypothetical protein